jgi:hypothetical protein
VEPRYATYPSPKHLLLFSILQFGIYVRDEPSTNIIRDDSLAEEILRSAPFGQSALGISGDPCSRLKKSDCFWGVAISSARWWFVGSYLQASYYQGNRMRHPGPARKHDYQGYEKEKRDND